MRTVLNSLDPLLFMCAFVVLCFGAYHDFMFKAGWRREWMDGRGRWGLFNVNIPEPYRTHRRRSNQAVIAFFAVLLLWACLTYLRRNVF
jgi:hypothetical protein